VDYYTMDPMKSFNLTVTQVHSRRDRSDHLADDRYGEAD
jgi:hypothetical protein